MLLIFFFVLATTATIKRNNPTSYEPASVVNFLGNGFDLKAGTYSLAPIFRLTYDYNATWTSPHSKITYSVPDQMFLHPLDLTFESTVQSVAASYTEFYETFLKRFTFSVGIEIGKFGGGFKYDKQMGFIRDTMNKQYTHVVHGTHFWAFNVGSMYPAYLLDLDPMCERAINRFPQRITTQQDRDYATEFMQTFGQFYVYRSAFGAQLDFNVAVSESLTKKYSKEWVFTEVGLSFHYALFNVSAGGFANRTEIHINDTFLALSKTNTTFYGGDPTLTDINKLSLWVNSIDQNLFPLNSTFMPIWTVVKDPVKQETMKNFMVSYLK